MVMFSQDAARAFKPEEIGQLVTIPTLAQSVAFQAAGYLKTKSNVHTYRIPVVTADPSAAWTAEGAEIAVSDQALDEVADNFHKVAGLTVVTRELAADSSPAAANLIGLGLSRDIAKKIDLAVFGSRGAGNLPPEGLGDLEDVNTIEAGTAWANIDPFSEAIYDAAEVGAALNTWVANPADAKILATLKRQKDSNEPLLGPDATEQGKQQIQGIPLLVSPAVEVGTVWGIPANNLVALPVREDVTLDISRDAFFTSDKIAIRATMRMTALYPHQAAIQKITLTA